ncbi:hypothetical protein JHK86_011292 [Glycine max]|nr:hypothetical protein JHK86_011292 [Glycine max]
MGRWFTNAKPYLMLLAVQFGSAGMFILAMDAIKKGMSHYVFIVYRNAIASMTLAPFAFVLERKVRSKMTVRIFSEIMALAFFEDQIIIMKCGIMYGSYRFKGIVSFVERAISQCLPFSPYPSEEKRDIHIKKDKGSLQLEDHKIQFSDQSSSSVQIRKGSIYFCTEHMKMKEVACQAKVIGTIVTFGGTLLMALYKGPLLSNVNNPTGNHWILGTCFLLIGCAGFSAFYILQTITLRKYPTEKSLATRVCFVGALQSSIVAAIAERHHPHAWALGWDTRLFAPAYAGIVTSGVQYYIQGMVIKSMGPVIVTAFNPLRMIIITTLACIVLSEQLYLGSIIGAIVVVLGLYLVVWGKYKECHGRSMPPSPEKDNFLEDQRQLSVTVPKNDTNDNKG